MSHQPNITASDGRSTGSASPVALWQNRLKAKDEL